MLEMLKNGAIIMSEKWWNCPKCKHGKTQVVHRKDVVFRECQDCDWKLVLSEPKDNEH